MKLTTLLLTTTIALVSTMPLAGVPTIGGTISIDDSVRSASDLKRDKTSKPRKVIEFANIGLGMKVADILGGGGYYSEMLSQVVGPQGKVYLHNNQTYLKYVGKELKQRVDGKRLSNVVDYQREMDDLGFKDGSLDAVFFVLGYHDMYHSSDEWHIDAKDLLAQLNRALEPGGTLLVIDHAAPQGTGTKHSQKLHRVDEDYVKQELLSSGFVFVKSGQMLRNSHDSRKISPFRPEIRRKTDRFVQLYSKK